MKAIKITLSVIAFVVVFGFIMEGLIRLSCINESSGTMVVIGGNSMRCR